MCPAGVDYLHLVGCDVHVGLSPDKMAKDLLRAALLETSELLGQHAVESVGGHGHQDVEVHLHQDGGRQGVEVEKLDRLGDDILHPPPECDKPDSLTVQEGQMLVGRELGIKDEGGRDAFMNLLP